jgi:hypothetical protein
LFSIDTLGFAARNVTDDGSELDTSFAPLISSPVEETGFCGQR